MNDKNFGYRAKLEDANYHAVNLLALLKKLDVVCMPEETEEITIIEIEQLYTNLSDLVDYINKKRYWRLNNG